MGEMVVLPMANFGYIVDFSSVRKETFIVALGTVGCPISENMENTIRNLAGEIKGGVFFFFVPVREKDFLDLKKVEERLGLNRYPSVVVLKKGKCEKAIYPKKDDNIKEKIKDIL
jgi:hypothetical protein